MKNVWVALLITVLFSECEGCLKQESDALLRLKAHFGNPRWSFHWANDGRDCCQWENVVCNNTTGRVVGLYLFGDDFFSFSETGGPGKINLNMSDFYAFEDLTTLSLGGNKIAACVESEALRSGTPLRLRNLRYLHLGNNLLDDSSNILSCLSGLSSVEFLNIAENHLTVKSFHSEGKLSWPTNLAFLHLSHNKLSNDYISLLNELQHLKSLDLSYNQLEGSVDISGICALSKLEKFDLSGNSNISSFAVPQGTNTSLSNVKVFYLNNLKMEENMLKKLLRAFPFVRKLSLVNEKFIGTFVAEDFGELDCLEDLRLRGSYIGSKFFKNIGAMASLRRLSVKRCRVNGTLINADWSNLQNLKVVKVYSNEFEGPLPITGWFKLKKLEELYFFENKFKGLLPLSFVNMTSLRILDLSSNSFNGSIASHLETLPLLEDLDFSRNHFEVLASLAFLANYSNLKFIYGGGNKLIPDAYPTFQNWVPKFQLQEIRLSSTTEANSLPLPNFLIHQYNLSVVDLSGSKFETEFPKWLLENNTKMTTLVLRNCSLSGHFQLPSHPLPNIETIDVSNNALTGQIPAGENASSIFPNLRTLNMSRNAITGSLPWEFVQINFLDTLDLSYNHLSGEIPKNISTGQSTFFILNLSNNKLDGLVCSTLMNSSILSEIYLGDNSFSGSVESCFKNQSFLSKLDLSNNHLVGKIPSFNSFITQISIANNYLEGSISPELFELGFLSHLDLSKNNLSGSIPSFANSSLNYINLSNNKLSGLVTSIFEGNSSLIILDLSNNEITSTLQHLIRNAFELSILLLRGNHFLGQIPYELCQLKSSSIIDLSYNRLSGPLPNCLSEISFGANKVDEESLFYLEQNYSDAVNFTTKSRSYTYKGNILLYMSGMDLSHNELNGTIPLEFGNLTQIRAMNLSHNYLTGEIPSTFSNLNQIESLDLSFNKLSGHIPHELTELTYLEVFSLAYNNLSGTTPERKGQFITFDEKCYEGNPFLCGPPLNKSCNDYNGPAFDANKEENDGFMDMQFFYISFLVSYASILLVMATILYINPHWRRAWFYFMEFVITNCYYFVVDNFQRWFTY